MRLMRRTKQGLTAAAVLALISGGGVTVLTNNAMTRQIDQMAAEYGIDLNTAETLIHSNLRMPRHAGCFRSLG